MDKKFLNYIKGQVYKSYREQCSGNNITVELYLWITQKAVPQTVSF